jgi:hypothetical protein
MCCVSARRLSIHKTYNKFRISLLNNCKKDFQFHIKTTEKNYILDYLLEYNHQDHAQLEKHVHFCFSLH